MRKGTRRRLRTIAAGRAVSAARWRRNDPAILDRTRVAESLSPRLRTPCGRWLSGRIAAVLLLAACATPPPASPPEPERAPASPGWQAVITPADHDRLRRLPEAWRTALSQARQAGHDADIAALGVLADPGAVLPDAAPPPGRYRCRTIKMGAQGDLLDYIAYSWFACEITAREDGTLRLDKLSGSQRQQGTLYRETDRRLVFLGALALGSGESAAPPYGADRERDVVGVLERVGPERWRLVQPWPRFETNLDLLEMQPV